MLEKALLALHSIFIFMMGKVIIVLMKSMSTCQSLLKLLLTCALTCLVMSNINCFLTGFHHMICYYIWKQKRFLMLEQHVLIGYKVVPCKSWSLGNELLMWYKFRTRRRKMSWQQCSANSIMCCLYWASSITGASVQKGQDKEADSFRIQ